MKLQWVLAWCLPLGLGLWGLAVWLWRDGRLDSQILLGLDPLRRDYSPVVALSRLLSDYGLAFITGIYLLLVSLSLPKRKQPLPLPAELFLTALVSLGIAELAAELLKALLQRPRPIIAMGEMIQVCTASSGWAMPSGHTAKAIAFLLPVLLPAFWPGKKPVHTMLRWGITGMTLGVAASRLVVGAHYLSDVLAGAGTALLGLPLALWISRRYLAGASPEVQAELPGTIRTIFLLLLPFFLFFQ